MNVIKNRINLFHQNRNSTFRLLSDYLSYRKAFIHDILILFTNKMKQHAKETNNEDYKRVSDMFTFIADNVYKGVLTLKDFGIGVVSFCRTWMRDGNERGSAGFSIMSPHFQTRFYVKDLSKLKKYIKNEFIDSYVTVVREFTVNLQENYGMYEKGTCAAFINLDKLYNKLKKEGFAKSKKRSRRKSKRR